jgi:hypothetical protein
MPVEMALDLASLALYDIILFGEHVKQAAASPHGCLVNVAAGTHVMH